MIEGKSEMYAYLSFANKTTFINLEDPIQVEKSQSLTCYSFGINKSSAAVNITAIEANPFVTIKYDGYSIVTHLIGLYNANNINAALTIGKYFEVPMDSIKEALENYIPENNRSQMVVKGSNTILLDAYNANPSSMAVAIDNFIQLEKPNKILVLGDMFELGEESLFEHQQLVQRLSGVPDVRCFFVGKAFFDCRIVQDNFQFYATFDGFSAYLIDHPFSDATLLIKGSRGMALERTLNYL